MPSVSVTIRDKHATEAPDQVQGEVPFAESPLAVTPNYTFTSDGARGGRWHERPGFCITHVPTGFILGDLVWDDKAAALEVLLACEPTFPAWLVAGSNNAALMACKYKFKVATSQGSEPK